VRRPGRRPYFFRPRTNRDIGRISLLRTSWLASAAILPTVSSVFKTLADRLAREPISQAALEPRVLRHLWAIDEDTGDRARTNRGRAIERVPAR
jgi:hypothetical protein